MTASTEPTSTPTPITNEAVPADAMDHIKAGDTPLECTVTYPPTMASSAISLARLIAQGKGMDDLVELQVTKLIVLQSETVTKDNVDKYRPLGFKS